MLRARLRSQVLSLFDQPSLNQFVLKGGAFTLGNPEEPCGGLFAVRVFKLTGILNLTQKLIRVGPLRPSFAVA
jgi:hypothetical protein